MITGNRLQQLTQEKKMDKPEIREEKSGTREATNTKRDKTNESIGEQRNGGS
jgi:hypothetical protein